MNGASSAIKTDETDWYAFWNDETFTKMFFPLFFWGAFWQSCRVDRVDNPGKSVQITFQFI